MKLLQILKEIGDASRQPYKYTTQSSDEWESYFTWKTEDGVDYVVEIIKFSEIANPNELEYNIDFGIVHKSGRVDQTSTSKNTKTGNIYRIMSTVLDIILKEMERDKKKYGRTVVRLSFTPSKNFDKDNRRLNLYMSYIKKKFPTSKVSSNSVSVIVTLNPKSYK